MPTKKRPARRASTTKSKRPAATTAKGRGGTAKPRSKGLQCPDCDFVAAHPMGLGRHRSARHGVQSLRQRRKETSGAWLTRREAARRAGVHYNTIRFWERTGRIRRSKGGGRGALVSAIDLESLSGGGGRRGAAAGGQDGARIAALERRFNDLLRGLERLVAAAGTAAPARGRPPKALASKGRRG